MPGRAEGVVFWLAVAACSLLVLFCLFILPYAYGSAFALLLFVTVVLTLAGLLTHRSGAEWRRGWGDYALSVGTAGLAGLVSWFFLSWWAS